MGDGGGEGGEGPQRPNTEDQLSVCALLRGEDAAGRSWEEPGIGKPAERTESERTHDVYASNSDQLLIELLSRTQDPSNSCAKTSGDEEPDGYVEAAAGYVEETSRQPGQRRDDG